MIEKARDDIKLNKVCITVMNAHSSIFWAHLLFKIKNS